MNIGRILFICLTLFGMVACSQSLPESTATSSPVPTETPEPNEVLPTPTQEWIQCEEDLSCILEITESCHRGNYLIERSREIIGETDTVKYRFTLFGVEEGDCLFQVQIENVEVYYSDRTWRNMRNMGFREDQIDMVGHDKEQKIMFYGFNDTCRGDQKDLIPILTNPDSGLLLTEDWSSFECTDRYSKPEKPTPKPQGTLTPTPDPSSPDPHPSWGENLIDYPSFEIDPRTIKSSWVEEWNDSDLRVEWTDEAHASGDYSLLFRMSSGYLKKSPGMYLSELIPVESGDWINYEIWVSTPDGVGAMTSVDFYDENMRYLYTSSTKCERLDIPHRWRRVGIGVLLDGDAAYARPGFQSCLYQSPWSYARIYFDDVFFSITK